MLCIKQIMLHDSNSTFVIDNFDLMSVLSIIECTYAFNDLLVIFMEIFTVNLSILLIGLEYYR